MAGDRSGATTEVHRLESTRVLRPVASPQDRDGADTEQVLAQEVVRRRLLGADREPTEIGRYRIVDVIGRGAFGAVYRARDPELGREVALKVLTRASAEVGGGEARFVREARAIAAVSHPNVVAVFDVGTYATATARARVFIAMELIEGQSLLDWLGGRARSLPEILAVFRGAARGLAAAHARGIVHRDFKPANVIVGDDGTAKVVDFGLARVDPSVDSLAATDRLTPAESADTGPVNLTQSGIVMGTPRYMAPEQHAGQDVGVAADQYAFAVALYEALYGAPPFDAKTVDRLAEQKRSGELARRSPPSDRPIPMWLDRAIARGLRVEPGDRWPSMSAFADALEPRTRRGWWAAGVGALLVGATAWIFVAGPADDAGACDPDADPVADTWTDARRDAIAGHLQRFDSGPARHASTALPTMVDDYAASIRGARHDACLAAADPAAQTQRMACIDDGTMQLHAVLTVIENGDAAVAESATRLVARLPDLETCATVRTGDGPGLDTDAIARDRELRRRLAEVRVQQQLGHHATALGLGQRLLVDIRAEAADPVLAARTLGLLGAAEHALRRYDDAIASFREAYEIAKASGADDEAAGTAAELAIIEAGERGRYDEAERWLRHAEAAAHDTSSEHLRSLLLTAKATLFIDTGRAHEAVDALEQARAIEVELGSIDGELAVIARLAMAHQELDHSDDVLVLQQEYLARAEKLYGPRHPMLTSAMNSIAGVISGRGEYDEALKIYAEITDIIRTQVSPEDPRLVYVEQNVALALEEAGRFDEAAATAQHAIELADRILGEDTPTKANMLQVLGRARAGVDRHEDALRAFEAAQSHLERIGAPFHGLITSTAASQAEALCTLGRHDEALTRLDAVRTRFETQFGPDHPAVASLLYDTGEVHLDAGDPDAAVRSFQLAIDRGVAAEGSETLVTAMARMAIVRARLESDPELAVREARLALEVMRVTRRGGPPHAHAELLLAKALRAADADPAEVRAHADVAVELLAELGDGEADALAEARALR